ncbi:MAG: hypothetical protein KDC67_04380 [Ignavibacteriae bacterium]|nr:hypothetical protein [Ignavibacteriota bacterium]
MNFYGNNTDKFTVNGVDIIAPSVGEVLSYDFIEYNGEIFDFTKYRGHIVKGSNNTLGTISTTHFQNLNYIKYVCFKQQISNENVGVRLGQFEKTYLEKKYSVADDALPTDTPIAIRFCIKENALEGVVTQSSSVISIFGDNNATKTIAIAYYNKGTGKISFLDGNNVPISWLLYDELGQLVLNNTNFDFRTAWDKEFIIKFNVPSEVVGNEAVTNKTVWVGRGGSTNYFVEMVCFDIKIGTNQFWIDEMSGIYLNSGNGDRFTIDKLAPIGTETQKIDQNVWMLFNKTISDHKLRINTGGVITFSDTSTYTTEGEIIELVKGIDTYPLNEAVGNELLSNRGNIATFNANVEWKTYFNVYKVETIKNATRTEERPLGSYRVDVFGNIEQKSVNGWEDAQPSRTFSSLDNMKKYNIQVGLVYRTSSYHYGKGYGGNMYLASNKKDKKIDNGLYIRADNGIVLELLHNNTVDYFSFGAISNVEDPTSNQNDSWKAIQNCYDCGLNVRGNAGHFYTSKTLVLSKKNTIQNIGHKMSINQIYEYDSNGNITGEVIGNEYDNVTRIYTDQNIRILHIKEERIKIFNGVIDASLVPLHDKELLNLDLDYNLQNMSFVGMTLKGNISSLVPIENDGSIGIRLNREEKTRGLGSLAFSKIDVNIESCRYPILIDPKNTNINGGAIQDISWVNSTDMKGHISHFKTAIHCLENSTQINFDFTIQPYWSLHPNEKDLPAILLNGANRVNIQIWDLTTNSKGGLGTIFMQNNYGKIGNAVLVEKTYVAYNLNAFRDKTNDRNTSRFDPPKNIPTMLRNPMNFTVSSKPADGVGKNRPVIAPIHNYLAYINKRYPSDIYVNAFEGVYDANGLPYDFENELETSVGLARPSSNITINNPYSMFEFERHNNQTEIVFETGADENNDFIEIGLGTFYTYSQQFHVLLSDSSNVIKSMQLLQHTSSNNDYGYWLLVGECFGKEVTGQNYNKLYDFSIKDIQYALSNFKLRIIGGKIGTPYKIIELFAESSYYQKTGTFFPLVHNGGDQNIYGIKDFKEDLKLLGKSLKPSNKTGAIWELNLAGDSYNTTTGATRNATAYTINIPTELINIPKLNAMGEINTATKPTLTAGTNVTSITEVGSSSFAASILQFLYVWTNNGSDVFYKFVTP